MVYTGAHHISIIFVVVIELYQTCKFEGYPNLGRTQMEHIFGTRFSGSAFPHHPPGVFALVEASGGAVNRGLLTGWFMIDPVELDDLGA